MTTDFYLRNGNGNTNVASVTGSNSVLVTPTNYQALENQGEPSRKRLLSGLLGSTGLDSGITDAGVDGSVNTQTFYIESNPDYDIMIMKLFIYIEDGSVTHSGFGSLGTLTNGVDVVAIEGGVETFIIKEAKKFTDLIAQTFCAAPFGSGASAFELVSTTGSQDSQILPFNLFELIPGGLRIGRGTKDRVELRVKDNLTGLTDFTIRVAGYRLYPPIRYKE